MKTGLNTYHQIIELIMSDKTIQAPDVVQREEENNVTATSNQADTAAAFGNYAEANKETDKSEEHTINASNIGAATGSG
ncbi:hypothetical protein FIE12Z_9493 [Fusarium flagelliforme]|uniref:Uncharacterized protein n=1 Tax=Fusarium flagelliforme TaxID=2675880 RepID=A0A395MED2_9HYPO|nr:hypothetical protein FIE12Z_9493 [Fusarium flagelliforme]